MFLIKEGKKNTLYVPVYNNAFHDRHWNQLPEDAAHQDDLLHYISLTSLAAKYQFLRIDRFSFCVFDDAYDKFVEDHPDSEMPYIEYIMSKKDEELEERFHASGLDNAYPVGAISFVAVMPETKKAEWKLDADQKGTFMRFLKETYPEADGIYLPGYIMTVDTYANAKETLTMMGRTWFKEHTRVFLGRYDAQVFTQVNSICGDDIMITRLYVPFILRTPVEHAMIPNTKGEMAKLDITFPENAKLPEENEVLNVLMRTLSGIQDCIFFPLVIAPEFSVHDFEHGVKMLSKAIR